MNANIAKTFIHTQERQELHSPNLKIQEHLEIDQGVETAALTGILSICHDSSWGGGGFDVHTTSWPKTEGAAECHEEIVPHHQEG